MVYDSCVNCFCMRYFKLLMWIVNDCSVDEYVFELFFYIGGLLMFNLSFILFGKGGFF